MVSRFWEMDDPSRSSGGFDWAGAGSRDAWEADWARTHGGQYPGPGRQAYEDALRSSLWEQAAPGAGRAQERGFFDRPRARFGPMARAPIPAAPAMGMGGGMGVAQPNRVGMPATLRASGSGGGRDQGPVSPTVVVAVEAPRSEGAPREAEQTGTVVPTAPDRTGRDRQRQMEAIRRGMMEAGDEPFAAEDMAGWPDDVFEDWAGLYPEAVAAPVKVNVPSRATTPTGRMSNESLANELMAWARANGVQGGPLRLVDELKGAFGLKLPDVRKGGRLSRSELKQAVEAARKR